LQTSGREFNLPAAAAERMQAAEQALREIRHSIRCARRSGWRHTPHMDEAEKPLAAIPRPGRRR
jgi:hypothetical protein